MKIVLVQRKSGSGFSLEAVYGTIYKELNKKINITLYKLNKKNIFRDLLALRSFKADLYHVTGDIHYLSLFLPKNKSVLTIHDVGRYVRDLKGLKRWMYKIIWITLPIYFSKAVFFSSEITKKRVKEVTKLKKKQNFIAKLCSNLEFKNTGKRTRLKTPYILHVGTAKHKNLRTVIKSVEEIECKLLIIGELSESDLSLLNNKKIKFKNFINISKTELEDLYMKADLLIFPSLHEGFGLPIVEAQAANLPVITSNISPMIEVSGEGAVLIDPLNVESMTRSINKILSDSEFTKKLVKKGSENAKAYSAKLVASEHLDYYQQILNSNN